MLQGSLDNFALDEVLGLLSSTAKTGKLELKGDRGTGSLSLQTGQLVAASVSNTANGSGTEDVVFELMRFTDGTFSFNVQEVEATEAARAVPDVLAAAEGRLADWRVIEAVVPSLNHSVSPVPALPTDEITINRREWSTLIVIGAGCPVSTVCSELDLGEVEGSRQIKILAERGLVSVGPPLGKSGSGYVPRPVDGVSRPGADPFARKAEQSNRRIESLTGIRPSDMVELPAGLAATVSRDLPVEPVGRGANGRGPVDNGRGSSGRPPMPAPPTSAELRRADTPAMPSRAAAVPVLAGELPEPEAETPAMPAPEPSKPGGLLMRYLKGED